jgi:hypothetical protein
MARKVHEFTHASEDRDNGKRFRLTEMSAAQAERWAMRAFLLLAASGAEVPDDAEEAGFAGLATLGLKALAGVRYEDAEPLLGEMLRCVEIAPDVAKPVFRKLDPSGDDADIEEPGTYLMLRKEVFRLHVDFSKVAALWKSKRAATGQNTQDGSPNIETSPG